MRDSSDEAQYGIGIVSGDVEQIKRYLNANFEHKDKQWTPEHFNFNKRSFDDGGKWIFEHFNINKPTFGNGEKWASEHFAVEYIGKNLFRFYWQQIPASRYRKSKQLINNEAITK